MANGVQVLSPKRNKNEASTDERHRYHQCRMIFPMTLALYKVCTVANGQSSGIMAHCSEGRSIVQLRSPLDLIYTLFSSALPTPANLLPDHFINVLYGTYGLSSRRHRKEEMSEY